MDTYREALDGTRTMINRAYVVMVALDEEGKTRPVPGLLTGGKGPGRNGKQQKSGMNSAGCAEKKDFKTSEEKFFIQDVLNQKGYL